MPDWLICVIEWLHENRNWFFSASISFIGAIVSIISLIISRKNSKSINNIVNLSNVQNNTTINNGIGFKDTLEISKYIDDKFDENKKQVEVEINKIYSEIPQYMTLPIESIPLNIIKPATELAILNHDNILMRKLLYKLIHSAMCIINSELTHPSFIEIIKQLSPLDASNIAFFKKHGINSMVDFSVGFGTHPLISNVALGLGSERGVHALSASITNLIRLGLIERVENELGGGYEDYEAEDVLSQVKMLIGVSAFNVMQTVRYAIKPTSLGRAFIATCVDDSFV